MVARGLGHRLRDFGFSEKEVAVYRAVLELGEAKPSEIASAADVSTRYAYEVGEKLEERGFVTVHDQVTPTTMRAVPPGESIRRLTEELAALEPALRERYEAPSENTLEVELIKTTSALRKRMRELTAAAKERIVLAIPPAGLEHLEADLRAARERGVFVLLILVHTEKTVDVSELADVARIDADITTGLLGIDQAKTVVMTADMVARTNTDDRAISCSDERIARLMFSGFMGDMWLMADEYYRAEPVELPATFECFWSAVLHTTLHLQGGGSINADVTGTATDGDAPIEISGAVLEVKQTLLDPVTSDFPGEQAIVVDAASDTYSVGGTQAFREDIRASELTLRAG